MVEDLDEAMPGFHEEEENEPDLSQHDDTAGRGQPDYIARLSQHDDNAGVSAADFGLDGEEEGGRSAALVHSGNPASSNKPSSAAVQPSKPTSYAARRSTSAKPPSKRLRSPSPAEEEHDCPICGKTLATDNDGLNQHIDWCLSRGAILEAQRQSSRTSGAGAQDSNARTKFKPRR